jgi:predicted TPR repeat methyltransferase
MPPIPVLLSSGDLIADRRYAIGQSLLARGDLAGAADLFRQAAEAAPDFAAAWFALGEACAKLGERKQAVRAFETVRALDPADRLGASLHLIRLGALAPAAMPGGYVQMLFDHYASRFDVALARLDHRAPALLHAAVAATCGARGRPMHFACALDLGCGTGLGGVAFRPHADRLVGVDLSEKMIAQARARNLYDRLITADLAACLAGEAQAAAAYDLVIAADVFGYLADLADVVDAAARVLAAEGLLAFTVETHAGDGVILSEALRYAHGRNHVRAIVARAGLNLVELSEASSRCEAGVPVPGLVAVAQRA